MEFASGSADDDYSIITVMLSDGQQDLYKINYGDSITYEEVNLDGQMSEGSYIGGVVDVLVDGERTYICYVEGAMFLEEGFDYSWSRRMIAEPSKWTSEDYWQSGFSNGIGVMAIQNGEVMYQGHFESEISKGLADNLEDLKEGRRDFEVNGENVTNITMTLVD